jgi:hypothetical protein
MNNFRKKLSVRQIEKINKVLSLEEIKEEKFKESEKEKSVIKKDIIEMVIEYKKLIKGNKSFVDLLELDNKTEDECWNMIERNKIIKELSNSDLDFEEEDEEKIKLRRSINKKFDQYYGLDFEDIRTTGETFKFKYKEVSKENFGLSTKSIFFTPEEELIKVAPISDVLK